MSDKTTLDPVIEVYLLLFADRIMVERKVYDCEVESYGKAIEYYCKKKYFNEALRQMQEDINKYKDDPTIGDDMKAGALRNSILDEVKQIIMSEINNSDCGPDGRACMESILDAVEDLEKSSPIVSEPASNVAVSALLENVEKRTDFLNASDDGFKEIIDRWFKTTHPNVRDQVVKQSLLHLNRLHLYVIATETNQKGE